MKKLILQIITLFLCSYSIAQIPVTGSKLQAVSPTSTVSGGSYDQILFPGNNKFLGVGIGNPEYRLDVNGRIRLRRGSDSGSGLWFNNYADISAITFAGMESDVYWGIWGNNTWRFSVNINTGALKINGNEGRPGDLMMSNGANGAQWTSVTGMIPSAYADGSGAVSPRSTQGQPLVPLPMLNFLTITVYRKSRLLVSGHFVAEGPKCNVGCGDGAAYIFLDVAGVDRSKVPAALLISAGANSIAAATLSNYAVDVNPGTYTLTFKVFSNPNYGELSSIKVLQSSVVALPLQ